MEISRKFGRIPPVLGEYAGGYACLPAGRASDYRIQLLRARLTNPDLLGSNKSRVERELGWRERT